MERTDHGYLENELKIKISPDFSRINPSDQLEIFEVHNDFKYLSILSLLLTALLYFVDPALLLVFFLNIIFIGIRYLWNFKYTFKRRPLIVINSIGITEKDHLYLWAEIFDLSCSEEFDNERSMFTATHLRFTYHGDVKKIYIGGYDKSIEEIIHYVAIFRRI